MSAKWRLPVSRPRSAGKHSTRLDGPPDGWERLDGSLSQLAASQIDVALLRATDAAARGIGRRQFLKRAGQIGLVAGLGITNLVWDRPARASHNFREICCNTTTCDGISDQFPGACGPSAPCRDAHCATNGQCKLNHTHNGSSFPIQRQLYATGNCSGSNADNCWTEDCCSENGFMWKCCDCCENHPSSNNACNCAGKFRCICRERQQAC